jgi:hypothetical protein
MCCQACNRDPECTFWVFFFLFAFFCFSLCFLPFLVIMRNNSDFPNVVRWFLVRPLKVWANPADTGVEARMCWLLKVSPCAKERAGSFIVGGFSIFLLFMWRKMSLLVLLPLSECSCSLFQNVLAPSFRMFLLAQIVTAEPAVDLLLLPLRLWFKYFLVSIVGF